jgi:hypothetical protein
VMARRDPMLGHGMESFFSHEARRLEFLLSRRIDL